MARAAVRVKSVKGVNELRSALKQAGDRARQAGARAVREEAEDLLSDSKPLVPVDTGTLRNTGTVEGPTWKGSVVTAIVGYGSAAVDYAVIVHERLDLNHPVGQAKFLEQPALEHERDLEARLAKRIRKAIS